MIIALSGYKGSGKDTLANFFIKRHQFIRHAFADKIKDVCSDILQLDPTDLDDFKRGGVVWNGKEIPGRDIVRGIGMLMRSYDEKQFVSDVDQRIASERSQGHQNFVITDLRFDNEVEWLDNQTDDVLIVFITRPNIGGDNHVSEQLDHIKKVADVTIVNDGTINDLWQKANSILDFINRT